MKLAGLEKNTLMDFPDKVACIVFTHGCNFRCPYCHNSQILEDGEAGLSEEQFFSFLNKRQGLLDGVVVTGGEPCIHKDISEFVEKIKNLGFLVKLDTNGYFPGVLEKMIEKKLIDYITMDVKNDLENYSDACGVSLDKDKIKRSIELIKNSGIDHEFRTTVVPGLHNKENMKKISELISNSNRFFIQNFIPKNCYNPEYNKKRPYDESVLEEFKEICEKNVSTELRINY